MKHKERTSTISDAISEAFSALEELGGEMREAFDNTPESLQQSTVGEARETAADALESLSDPSVPSVLESIPVVIYEPIRSPSALRKLSRPARRDDAASILSQVIGTLDGIVDDENYSEEVRAAASEFRDEVDNLMAETEGVEFPGMYG